MGSTAKFAYRPADFDCWGLSINKTYRLFQAISFYTFLQKLYYTLLFFANAKLFGLLTLGKTIPPGEEVYITSLDRTVNPNAEVILTIH